ncbi:MAG TPA: phage tail tape measure protein, partial [Porticoccus sp.]|nr:phage tail tape measure protein [Porticoccus sp.]
MSSAQLQDLTLTLKTIGFRAGTVKVTALRQAISGANTAAKGSAAATSKSNKVLVDYGDKTKRAAKSTQKMTKAVKEQGQGFLGLNDTLDQVIKKVALWTVATGAIFGTIRAVKALGETITEHDTQMTGLRKVYSGAQSDLAMIEQAVLQTSRRMQSLTKSATEAAVTVARTGRVGLDVIRLTEASLVAQNIAELEAAQAILFLNSALIQFNQTTDQTVRILDEWNELSNKTPATTIDLAMAVSVAGSVFDQAGASLQFLNANTAALVEITAKSGNIIGRAERTMAIYSQRQSTVNKLANIGIQVFEGLNQQFIGIDELLTRVAVKWEFLNDRQRASIAQAVAGTRQQQFFIALMANQDIVIRNLITQWGALGSAMKENEMFLESISKRTDGLINALERLAINIGDAGAKGAIKGMIETLTLMVNALNDANFAMSAIATMAGVLAARFAVLQLAMGVWGAMSLAIGAFIATLTALNGVMDTNAKFMREQEAANNRRIKAIGDEKSRLESIVETLSNLQAAREQLSAEERKSVELEERIETVLTALQKFYPELAGEIDILAFAYKTFNERLAEQNKLLIEQKRIGFQDQLDIINKSIQAQENLRSMPPIRSPGPM